MASGEEEEEEEEQDIILRTMQNEEGFYRWNSHSQPFMLIRALIAAVAQEEEEEGEAVIVKSRICPRRPSARGEKRRLIMGLERRQKERWIRSREALLSLLPQFYLFLCFHL
jgi:hypothetical protein